MDRLRVQLNIILLLAGCGKVAGARWRSSHSLHSTGRSIRSQW